MLGKTVDKVKKVKETAQKVKIVAVPKVMMTLAVIFLVIWTLIGLSILTLLILGERSGAFSGLINPSARQSQTSQVPTETELPGVGRVNVACVQSALSPQSIQKLLSAGDISVLEGEEKTNFEACLVK